MEIKKVLLMVAASVFAISANTLPSSAAQSIPEDAVTFGDHRYALYDVGKTWEDAKTACEEVGGHLATITSQEEQDAIKVLIEQKGERNSYWLGGHRTEEQTNSWYPWEWVTGEEFSYTHWGARQPDNPANENCLMIYKNRNPNSRADDPYTWNDLCNEGTFHTETFFGLNNFGYICEWDEFSSNDDSNDRPFPQELFIFQGTSTSDCVVSSATMMIRNKLYQANDQSYKNVTLDSVKAKALNVYLDMSNEYTYYVDNKSFTIKSYKDANDGAMPKEKLIEELKNHPEGLVFFAFSKTNSNYSHAVLLTKYKNGSFYCVNPGIISFAETRLEDSSFASNFGGYEALMSSYTHKIWRITNSSVFVPVTGVTLSSNNVVISEGGQAVQLTATVIPANAENRNVSWASANSNIASVDASGLVTPHNAGTTTITVTTEEGNLSAACTVTVTPIATVDSSEQNRQMTATEQDGIKYLYIGNSEVKVVGCTGSKTSLNIPDTITVGNTTYNVTTIGTNAFKKQGKLKKVIIGANVTNIESKAFYKCKKLKNIYLNTTVLKKVGSKAFFGINLKAKFVCPNKKLKKSYAKKIIKSNIPVDITFSTSGGASHKF